MDLSGCECVNHIASRLRLDEDGRVEMAGQPFTTEDIGLAHQLLKRLGYDLVATLDVVRVASELHHQFEG